MQSQANGELLEEGRVPLQPGSARESRDLDLPGAAGRPEGSVMSFLDVAALIFAIN